MKVSKIAIILAAALLVFGLASTSYAFHSGGVAECLGCHQMHNAPSGTAATPIAGLLVASDQSSTCLTCHGKSGIGSYHISTPDADMGSGVAPYNRTPGGDFGWIKKTYTWDSHGTLSTEDGDEHGHNIIAADFNFVADKTNVYAPGSSNSFAAANLQCNSCHDQHGQVRLTSTFTFSRSGGPIVASGSYNNSSAPGVKTTNAAVGTYRLLRSALSDNAHASGQPAFANNPVVAFAPSTYNRSEDTTMTRVQYVDNMSGYCGTCHAAMHGTNQVLTHPQDTQLSTLANNYNAYVSSGVMTGTSTNSYISLVPYEQPAAITDVASFDAARALSANDDSVLTGPNANSKVMCLSCHRAHASGFAHALRWDQENEFIVSSSGVWSANAGKTQAEEDAAYNNFSAAKFGAFQRNLCNKCHAKD